MAWQFPSLFPPHQIIEETFQSRFFDFRTSLKLEKILRKIHHCTLEGIIFKLVLSKNETSSIPISS
jgi:hypothetical protein